MSKKNIDVCYAVYAYAIAYMILTIIFCLPRILAEFTPIDVSHISEGFTFPLEMFAWGLMVICSLYCGVDRAAFAVKTSIMDIGTCDVGHPERLKIIIKILIIIFIENMILNFFLGHTFTVFNVSGKQEFKGIELPLKGIVSALVSSCVLYVAGDGAIGIAKNFGKESTPLTSKEEKDKKEK